MGKLTDLIFSMLGKSGRLLKIQSKWIPVSEGMPDLEVMVLVYCDGHKDAWGFGIDEGKSWGMGYLSKDFDGVVNWECNVDFMCNFSIPNKKVTHWMPIPEPYLSANN